MITFFTTCKNFTGLFGVIQNNAIKSWFSLGIPVEVIVFGNAEGLEDLKIELPIVHIREVKAFEVRVPYINAMFQKANEIAKYDIVCFLNADIIVTPPFVEKMLAVHNKLLKNYLVVGQRINFEIDELLEFGGGWVERLKNYTSKGELHDAEGSDLFLFPKGQYGVGTIPDLLVGRPGWDLWMIFDARQKRYKTIDLSRDYLIFHQNHDYSHKISNEVKRKEEDNRNYFFIPEKARYIFQLYACDYEVIDGKVVKKNAFENIAATVYHHELLFGKSNLRYWWWRFLMLFYKNK